MNSILTAVLLGKWLSMVRPLVVLLGTFFMTAPLHGRQKKSDKNTKVEPSIWRLQSTKCKLLGHRVHGQRTVLDLGAAEIFQFIDRFGHFFLVEPKIQSFP